MITIKELKGKISNVPKGVKASAAFFTASLVTKGIHYITTPIYTRLLTTSEYGRVSVFLTWFQLFGIVAMFCLSYGVFNNGMIDYPDKRDEYSFSMLVLSNVITIITGIIVAIVYPYIRDVLDLDLPLVILMFVLFIFQPAYNLWYTRERYEYKYKGVFFWSVFSSFISPLVAIIVMNRYEMGERLYPRIFGAELARLALFIGFYIYQGRRAKFKIVTKYWKSAFLFNLPLIPHYLSTNLLGSADRIMISNLVNDTATAYYSVAYAVASVATIVWQAVNASLVPYTYEKCKEKDYKSISRITLPIISVFAAACVFVIILAPEVVSIMATKEYREAIYVIPPIVGGVFFQVQYFIYTNIVYYYKKTKYVMIASVTSFCLNLILNYIFIRKFGYIAAGYTTLVSYLVQAIIDYFAMKTVVKEEVYDMKYVSFISFTVIAIALFSSFIYDIPAMRYIFLGIMLLLCIIYRNSIIAALKIPRKRKIKAD